MPGLPASPTLSDLFSSVQGMGEEFAVERLDIIDKIAQVLFDLANSGVDSQPLDPDLFEQLKTVGEIIIDSLGLNVTGHNGHRLLVELNNPI